MAEYRAYIVGADGHFVGFEPIVCADDTEAIEKADRLVVDNDVELWCGERLVRHLRVEDKPGGDASSHKVVRRADGAEKVIYLSAAKDRKPA
jgi:hypothetical protein